MTLEELLGHIKDGNWDWLQSDYSWLSSESGIHRKEPDGSTVAIFFIHGGRIRHQAQLPFREYSITQFVETIHRLAKGLENPCVVWSADTGGGDPGLWVEGTRLPNAEDVARLNEAKERQDHLDRINLSAIKKRLNLE